MWTGREPPFVLLMGLKIVAIMKTVWHFFKILKVGLAYDPAISLLDIYLKKAKLQCLLQLYLQWPSYGSILSVHQYLNG